MAGAATGFLAGIFNMVDASVAHYVSDTLPTVMAAISPVAHQCLTLYVMLWGFAMYRGLIHEPIMDGAFRIMKVGIILYFATNVGEFSAQISDNLIALPDFMASIFGGGGVVSSSKDTLDNIFTACLNLGSDNWQMASMTNLGPYFYAVMIWASSLICVGYAAFLIILSKVALALVVAFGPAAILCLMFEGTKKFFESWIGQALNYAFVSGLSIGVIKLLFGIYLNTANGALGVSGSETAGFQNFASMLLMSVICFLILMQVQSIASALGGGISISTMDAISWASSKARSFGGASRPSSMQRAIRGMQRDARALKAGGQKLATPVAWAARKMAGSGRNSVAANG